MSSAASRRSAAETARKQGSGLAMDPDADGPGVRGWLDGISAGHEIDYDYCKGCGICTAECPCGAISTVPESA